MVSTKPCCILHPRSSHPFPFENGSRILHISRSCLSTYLKQSHRHLFCVDRPVFIPLATPLLIHIACSVQSSSAFRGVQVLGYTTLCSWYIYLVMCVNCNLACQYIWFCESEHNLTGFDHIYQSRSKLFQS